MDWKKIRHYVLEKQHLADMCDDIVKCVEDIAGLNSITATTPYLSLFNRARGFRKSMLEEEMYEKKRLYKLRLMRGTLFIVTRDFLPIAYSATIDATQKRLASFRRRCRLSEKELERLKRKIVATLGRHGKTAREIRKELGENVSVSLVLRLLMEDVPLLRGKPLGTWKGEQFRYSLLPKGIQLRMNREKAKILLIEKFLESFGPATLKDIAWWSGFSRKESREILEKIEIVDIGDGLLLLEREAEKLEKFEVSKGSLLLLPAFDQYIITYRRSICPRLVDETHTQNIYNEYGELHNPIARNGRIVGRWSIVEGEIEYLLYEKIESETELTRRIREMEGFLRE